MRYNVIKHRLCVVLGSVTKKHPTWRSAKPITPLVWAHLSSDCAFSVGLVAVGLHPAVIRVVAACSRAIDPLQCHDGRLMR